MRLSCERFPKVCQLCAAQKSPHPAASREHQGDDFERRLEMPCLATRSPVPGK
jgi:hypothetical protein